MGGQGRPRGIGTVWVGGPRPPYGSPPLYTKVMRHHVCYTVFIVQVLIYFISPVIYLQNFIAKEHWDMWPTVKNDRHLVSLMFKCVAECRTLKGHGEP